MKMSVKGGSISQKLPTTFKYKIAPWIQSRPWRGWGGVVTGENASPTDIWIYHTHNEGNCVFFNTRHWPVLTSDYLCMNSCYFRTKGIPFWYLKCDAKHRHLSQLTASCALIWKDGCVLANLSEVENKLELPGRDNITGRLITNSCIDKLFNELAVPSVKYEVSYREPHYAFSKQFLTVH